MVVRFFEPTGQPDRSYDRPEGELAEVIEMRSWLPQKTVATKNEPANTVGVTDTPLASVEKAQTEIRERTALSDAIALLARKARSSGELRRELIASGHDSVDVDEVILECETSLYLDDLGLARLTSEKLRETKRASKALIRMKLRERLFDQSVIETVIAELDDEEESEILDETAKSRAQKMVTLDRATAERRLLGFLARRGFSGENAMRATRNALSITHPSS